MQDILNDLDTLRKLCKGTLDGCKEGRVHLYWNRSLKPFLRLVLNTALKPFKTDFNINIKTFENCYSKFKTSITIEFRNEININTGFKNQHFLFLNAHRSSFMVCENDRAQVFIS